MRDIWYSDNRDLAKWGVLFHIARSYSLRTIVQVPYLRPEKVAFTFTFRHHSYPLSTHVWRFFRDAKLAQGMSKRGLDVRVVPDAFDPRERWAYAERVREFISHVKRPLVIFLDPDTGLAPTRANERHVTHEEIRWIWDEISAGEWLVLYQHARRAGGWLDVVTSELTNLCAGARVEVARGDQVGKDAVFLCAKKT